MRKHKGYDWTFLADLGKSVSKTKSATSKDVERPFSRNIKAAKNNAIYGAHTYHTKVPPEGIIPYIEYYTNPGDVILDPFSGSGMTGVAANLLAATSKDNIRRVLLNDLGPAACHISYNHTHFVDPVTLRSIFESIAKKLSHEVDVAYRCWHVTKGGKAMRGISLKQLESAAQVNLATTPSERIQFRYMGVDVELLRAEVSATIWSHAHRCPAGDTKQPCGNRLILWDIAFDSKSGHMAKIFSCPNCKTRLTRADLEDRPEYVPVHMEYEYFCSATGRTKRVKRATELFDRELIEKISKRTINAWYPNYDVAPHREMMTMGPAKLGIRKISDFYFRRNLAVCARLWECINEVTDLRVRRALAFACTNTFWHATKMRRFNARGGARPLTGTLYIPQISVECNVMRVLAKKITALEKYYSLFKTGTAPVSISNVSATMLNIPTNSIDYIFTDPPFGGNIYYSDCSIIWEAWLERFTDESKEIHFNRSRKPADGGKTRDEYKVLIRNAFKEIHRVLKPGKWASIMFNNSDNDVLEVFRGAAIDAGFLISDVQFFDKAQKSFKGYLGRNGKQDVTNCDIVINVRKAPNHQTSTSSRRSTAVPLQKVTNEWVVLNVREYLKALPKRIQEQPKLFNNEHRTTPFLHAHLMRKIFADKKSFEGFTFEYLKALL
ncbi:MAG TPA: DNA methyltransferase, partial [Oligoflexia bacterium]|nr:DNA methyltransferase [Oligoflexia bacterium]